MTHDGFFYFEDIQIGQKFTSGTKTVTQDEIIAFARQYDPQDFHTDPEKAKDTLFGGLVASGWHTAAMTMRLILDATPKMKGGMIGRSIEKMGWPRPVHPGDTISLQIEIIDAWPSKGNPKYGMMRTKNEVRNQRGEIVQEGEVVIFVPKRPSA